ncbi:MAG TPA: ATP-binding protein [Halomicronema sp.]
MYRKEQKSVSSKFFAKKAERCHQDVSHLMACESRLSNMFYLLQDVLWSVDFESEELLYINQAVEVLYERRMADFFVNPNLKNELIHPEDRLAADEYQKMIHKKGNGEVCYRIVLASGEVRWVEERGWVVEDEAGRKIRIDGIVRDITKQKLAELEKDALIRQLQEDNKRKSEQLFIKQEKTLRTILDCAPIWIWMIARTGKMQFVNKTFCENVGVSEEKFLAVNHYSEILGVEESVNCMASDEACWSQDYPHHSEEILPFTDGKLHDLEVLKAKVKDDDGSVIGLIGLAMDVTEGRQQARELELSEARYKKLAQREGLLNRLAGDIRQSLDVETILETAVREIRGLLQVDRCSFAWYEAPKIAENVAVWEVVKEAKLAELPSFIGRHQVEVSPVLKQLLNGEVFCVEDFRDSRDPILQEVYKSWGFVSILSLPVLMPSGQIGLLVCGQHNEPICWQDSEVELLEAVNLQIAIALFQAELYAHAQDCANIAREKAGQLEETLHQLQQTQAQLIQTEKMSSLGQMVAGVAHEINNPVSFIHGNLIHLNEYTTDLVKLIELYKKFCPDMPAEVKEFMRGIELDYIVDDLPRLLASMRMGTERICSIVLSLRNFSRLDESEMKKVDIHEGIENTLLILQNRLRGKPGVSEIIVSRNYGDLPKVECYAGQLNQVLMNLLNNAIDALENVEDAKITISTGLKGYGGLINEDELFFLKPECMTGDERVVISIKDNGCGISDEVKQRLFDPFFTTKPVGKGTGLGLYICYQIIEKHKGFMWCESEEKKGSEFFMEIPLQQAKQ